jgi:ATP-binding cassette subfamily F protein uup
LWANIITGALEADSGKIETGETVVYGYYRQDGMVLDEQKRMIEVIQDIAEIIPQGNGRDVTASQFLEQFLFPRTQHYTYVYKLSGGEKRRLYLMTVLMKNPNFLILDEPTNDLDIMTLQVLEDYLKGFNGCALIVSHDRFFMDRVVDTLFIFEGEGIIKPFIGNYSDYYDRRKEGDKKLLLEKQEKQVTKEKPVGERQKKLSYKERQEYEGLEAEIERLQQEKSEIETALSSGIELDFEQVTRRYNEVNARIDEKELRWLELSELA